MMEGLVQRKDVATRRFIQKELKPLNRATSNSPSPLREGSSSNNSSTTKKKKKNNNNNSNNSSSSGRSNKLSMSSLIMNSAGHLVDDPLLDVLLLPDEDPRIHGSSLSREMSAPALSSPPLNFLGIPDEYGGVDVSSPTEGAGSPRSASGVMSLRDDYTVDSMESSSPTSGVNMGSGYMDCGANDIETFILKLPRRDAKGRMMAGGSGKQTIQSYGGKVTRRAAQTRTTNGIVSYRDYCETRSPTTHMQSPSRASLQTYQSTMDMDSRTSATSVTSDASVSSSIVSEDGGEDMHSAWDNESGVSNISAAAGLAPWDTRRLNLSKKDTFVTRARTPPLHERYDLSFKSRAKMNALLDTVDDQSQASAVTGKQSFGTFRSDGARTKTSFVSSASGIASAYSDEMDSFNSVAVYAEMRLRELWAREGGKGEAPNMVRSAMVAQLTNNVTAHLGRFSSVMEPLVHELLNGVYLDYYDKMNEMSHRRVELSDFYSLRTYAEQMAHYKALYFQMVEERDLANLGIDMGTKVSQFSTVQMAFNGPLMFIRDACFFQWRRLTNVSRTYRRNRKHNIKKHFLLRWRQFVFIQKNNIEVPEEGNATAAQKSAFAAMLKSAVTSHEKKWDEQGQGFGAGEGGEGTDEAARRAVLQQDQDTGGYGGESGHGAHRDRNRGSREGTASEGPEFDENGNKIVYHTRFKVIHHHHTTAGGSGDGHGGSAASGPGLQVKDRSGFAQVHHMPSAKSIRRAALKQEREQRRATRGQRQADRRKRRAVLKERRATGKYFGEEDEDGDLSQTSETDDSSDEEDSDEGEVMEDGAISISCQTPIEWMMGMRSGDGDSDDDDDDDNNYDDDSMSTSTKGSKSRGTKKKKRRGRKHRRAKDEDELGVKMAGSVIACLYEAKLMSMNTDPSNNTFKSKTALTRFAQETLRLRYGFKEMADKYWSGLQICCKKRSSDKRIALFANAMGLVPHGKDPAEFDDNRCSFFFVMLSKLYQKQGNKMAAHYLQGWLDRDHMLSIFRDTFYNLRVKQPAAFQMAETMLCDMPVVVKEESNRKVSRVRADEVMLLFMQFSATEITLRMLGNLSLRILLKLKMYIRRWSKRYRAKKAAEKAVATAS
jgi:hypothetical protein